MRDKLKSSSYVKQGLTLFCALGASILLFFIILRFEYIINFIVKILTILSPIFIGLLFAYLLNPIVKFFENRVFKKISKKIFKDKKNHKKFERILSIFITYFIVSILIFLFIKFVIPNLLESIEVMITNIPIYINNIYDWLKSIFKNSPELTVPIEDLNAHVTNSATNIVVPSMEMIMSNIATGITGFIKGIINVIIGLIVSVYLLYDKELFVKGTKKVLKVTLPKKRYETAITTLTYTDKIFGGFMVAKIIDSILIGIITFIITTIFNIPYALIISIIVGVTNIIPYFGPFIGAIPCAALLLMIDPKKCLTFVILILLIQQFDGNILGPKLIGNKTGIKSFWVLFSILLFGGLFGFIGMIFGVPVFAIIYSVIVSLIDKRLELNESK